MIENPELTLANKLADTAGNILRRYWRQPVAAEQKADLSPVTAADREVETAMRELITQHYPDHGIVGEEHGNSNPASAYQWVLDPIDGTRAFIAGYPTFTTLIALAKDGVPVLGIIDQPIMRERWIGAYGQATMCNGQPVTTRKTNMLAQAIISTTSLPYHFNADQVAAFERLRASCAQTIIGGDAYGYAMLASGRLDVFADCDLKPYDFCALVPIIEGAGGIITDWDGKPLTISSNGRVLAAANKELHQQALLIISSA